MADAKHTEVLRGTWVKVLTKSYRDLFAMRIDLSIWHRRRPFVQLFPPFYIVNHRFLSAQSSLGFLGADMVATEPKESKDAYRILRCSFNLFHKCLVLGGGFDIVPTSPVALFCVHC